MTTIKLHEMGGVYPGSLARNLPENGAQVAHNLLARTGEFRPLLTDAAEATVAVSNPASIYKYRGTWLASAVAMSFAPSQVNGDTRDRLYYTFNNGSAAPRVIDSTSTGLTNLLTAGRPLGVPAPAAAPTTTHNVVDELTVDELPEMDAVALAQLKAAFDGAFTTSYLGNAIAASAPTPSQIGWVAHGTAGMPSTAAHQWNLLVPMNGTVPAVGFEYVQHPRFSGKQVTYSASSYWAIPIELHAPVRQISGATLRTALLAIKNPYDATKFLLDPARTGLTPEIDSIVTSSDAFWLATNQPYLALVNESLAATAAIKSVLDGAVVRTTAAFYSGPAFTDALAVLIGSGSTGTVIERVTATMTAKITSVNPLTGETEYATGSSTYWAAVSGTNYTAIRTDVNACITTNTLGQKVFDAEKLKTTLSTRLSEVINLRPVEQRAVLRASLDEIAAYCIEPLVAFFAPGNIDTLSRGMTTDVGLALYEAMQTASGALNRLRDLSVDRADDTPVAADNAYNLGPRQRLAAAAQYRTVDTRFYICTYVNDWGEESAPSPVSVLVEPDQNDTVLLTCPQPPSGWNIRGVRLYRSNAGAQTAAFQYMTELSGGSDDYWVAQSNRQYTDQLPASALQEVCPTTTWAVPPSNLRALVNLPNGIVAGFFGSTVCFCEPYAPYAWPVEYQITTEHPIVAMGVFGQTLVVVTEGFPYYVSGADSASMSAQKLETPQACVSAASVVPVDGGVVYASPDGLCLAAGNGVSVITAAHFSRTDWQALAPTTMRCAYHDGVVYFVATGMTKAYALDPSTGKLGTVDVAPTAFCSDLKTDRIYGASGTAVTGLFAGTALRTAKWRSKIVVTPMQAGMAWVVAESDFAAPITVRWYGDGVLRHTATLASRSPVRLPFGRYLEHEIEVEAATRWNSLTVAGSTAELQGVPS